LSVPSLRLGHRRPKGRELARLPMTPTPAVAVLHVTRWPDHRAPQQRQIRADRTLRTGSRGAAVHRDVGHARHRQDSPRAPARGPNEASDDRQGRRPRDTPGRPRRPRPVERERLSRAAHAVLQTTTGNCPGAVVASFRRPERLSPTSGRQWPGPRSCPAHDLSTSTAAAQRTSRVEGSRGAGIPRSWEAVYTSSRPPRPGAGSPMPAGPTADVVSADVVG
jgi:hypothetical protein